MQNNNRQRQELLNKWIIGELTTPSFKMAVFHHTGVRIE